jgi:uncharacterized repeat protein (TIGR03803 family)
MPYARLHARFVGVAASLAGLLFALLLSGPVQAQSGHALYSFDSLQDGYYPSAGIIRDPAGNLYGTTWYGGAYDWGTVFKLSPVGVKTTLYSFHGNPDGIIPMTALIRDEAGNLYGTTSGGGTFGGGTVFKLSPAGKETVLHSFDPATEGASPSDLIRYNGTFYGTTYLNGPADAGAVFKMDAGGGVTTLYFFTGGTGGTDGANPNGITPDGSGNFYGTTFYGGSNGWGTVFKLDAAGNETVLFSFNYGSNTTVGSNPPAGVVLDPQGNLYGTTENGGSFHDAGVLFKMDQAGNETVLHTFYMVPTDGGVPESSLIRDAQGNLYGATAFGGTYGYGTVFKYDTAGNETVLHSFDGRDGEYPLGNLAMDAHGNIFGVCQQGGSKKNLGTVFVVTP